MTAAVGRQGQVNRKWVADTGSGAALIASVDCSTAELGTKALTVSEFDLSTANGPLKVKHKVTVCSPMLGLCIEPLLLRNTPPVISVGLLILVGWMFFWT